MVGFPARWPPHWLAVKKNERATRLGIKNVCDLPGSNNKKVEKYCAKLAEKSSRAFFCGVPLCWRELNLSNAILAFWSGHFFVSLLASTIRTGGCSPGFCCVSECLIGGQFTIITYMVGKTGQLTWEGFLR